MTGRVSGSSRATPLRRLLRYGQKSTMTGRLTDSAGQAIASAALVVESQIDRPGAGWKRVGEVVTAADGTWTAQFESGASRKVRVSYKAFGADAAPSAEVVASLRVRARLSLSVTPRRTSRAGKIVFKGRLAGGPGRARTQVTLYAVPGHGRRLIPVTVLSAGADGRFRYSYRFSGSFSNVTSRFQARVKSQPGYPYADGSSKLVSVRVR